MISKPCPKEAAGILAQLMVKLPGRMGRSVNSINTEVGINLYKYRNGNTFPIVLSLFDYCFTLGLDPSWLVYMACQVQHGRITEAKALDILSKPETWKSSVAVSHAVILEKLTTEPQET
jgi:hypothetical protein